MANRSISEPYQLRRSLRVAEAEAERESRLVRKPSLREIVLRHLVVMTLAALGVYSLQWAIDRTRENNLRVNHGLKRLHQTGGVDDTTSSPDVQLAPSR